MATDFERRMEYRGKSLEFCSRAELVACLEGMHRDLMATRKTRDAYQWEAIEARQRCERLLRAMGRDCARAFLEARGRAA